MKESYRKGKASHSGPESCASDREVAGEALTGGHAGRVSSCEITLSGAPTLLSEAVGNIEGGAIGKPPLGPAQSKTPTMHGNSTRRNREIPQTPVKTGRLGKADGQQPSMHVSGKSDGCIVPKKSPNKGQNNWLAEEMEGRRPTKGNAMEGTVCRTQSRISTSSDLQRVRKAAHKDRNIRFSALIHHVTVERLRESLYALERAAAPGVDEVTWKEYEVNLEERLGLLHDKIHKGAYRAQPSRRVYIPKSDGKRRPLGIASLEAR